MTTPATTLSAIRERQQSLIEAIVPASHSSVAFREHRTHQDFEAWAESTPKSCFRRYEARNATAGDEPEISDLSIIQETGSIQYMIAYPNSLALYGIDGRRDLDDLIDEDRRKVCGAIGSAGYSQFVDGQHNSACSWTITEGEAVTFLEIVTEVIYYRSAQS